jgi:ABC-type transport system involved in multi-copper enzyme maturation permease subunit
MLCFNVPALLVFSTFAAYLWAREYEENMAEIMMCYPYPKHLFLTAKLLIMLFVILLTLILFASTTILGGIFILHEMIDTAIFLLFSKITFCLAIMHFLIVPFAFFITIITQHTVAGLIWGIVGMCLCMSLYNTSFMQFLPPCIPFVLSDHMLGMNVMPIHSSYAIHWTILMISFVVVLSLGYKHLHRNCFPANLFIGFFI